MNTITDNERKAILHNRAVKLSEAAASAMEYDVDANKTLYVTFSIDNEVYAINDFFVQEVLTAKDITFIPGLPSFFDGIINIRGKVVSILNFRKLMQIPSNELLTNCKALILGNSDRSSEFGIVVDKISGTLSLYPHQIKPPPQNVIGFGEEFISGISPSGTIVLDAKTFIESSKLIVNQGNEKFNK